MKKILITGGAGYIGSYLSTMLVELGHQVTVIDLLKYSTTSLNHLFKYSNFNFIKGDVKNLNLLKKNVVKNEFIIPLAAYVGAPLCEKNKKDTKKVNLDNIKSIIKMLKKNQKIIYPTTNSGYGIGEKNKFCDENSKLTPISLYGRTKVDAEKEVMKFENAISFRLATIFGYSYRMRTDLIVNNFVLTAVKKNKLSIFEPHFRRNFIHIEDVCNAFIFSINNFKKLRGKVFNLGLSTANITKIQLAKKIQKKKKDLKIKIFKNRKDPDQRDYFVSNKKIEKHGFKATFGLDRGIDELLNIFNNSKVDYKNNY
jgi:nucleoside-diphosphate-sugar epimerase